MGTTNLDVLAANSVVAPLTGNVTGNVTGAVTGNVTGNLTGNVTGNVTGAVVGNAATFVPGSVVTGITAHAGGTQALGLLLTGTVNSVDTVGSAADSVLLPVPTVVGQQVYVLNNTATNSMQVFGSGTDTINGVASATGVAQAAGKLALYQAITIGTAAKWFRLLSA